MEPVQGGTEEALNLAECSFCGDHVALPYTCSLCKQKFCGKHRLAENHECPNIGVYQTKEYRKNKIQKDRELSRIKSGSMYTDTNRTSTTSFRSSLFGTQNFWVSDNATYDLALGGFILALSAIIDFLIRGIPFDLIIILSTLIMGALGFILLGKIRKKIADSEGVITRFEIWPLGIAITLITSLFVFRFLMFGFFINSNGSPQGEVKTALYTIVTSIMIWVIGFFFFPVLMLYLPNSIVLGLIFGATAFLWYGVVLIFPFGMLDGIKLFNYDRTKFWILLGILIALIIVDYSLGFYSPVLLNLLS